MSPDRNTGFAELKAVAMDILQGTTHRHEPGSDPMDKRDEDTKAGPHAAGRASKGRPDPMPAASDRGHEGQGPATGTERPASHEDVQGRAGGRQDPALNATEDRQEEFGAGSEHSTAAPRDADAGNWPPGDWNSQGNANRHGQVHEGRGPGGYDDRSRELRDFGPGPEGSRGEAWRTYEHHAEGNPESEEADEKARQSGQPAPTRDKP